MRQFQPTLTFARSMDQQDPLHHFRDHFHLKKGEIYMDGNSLGLSSKEAEASLMEVMNVWKEEGIQIWGTQNGRYFKYSRHLAEKLKSLIGADSEEIIVMGSITSNLLQAFATFYHPTKERFKVVVDALNFPTDIYAITSMMKLKDRAPEEALVVVESRDGRTLDEEDIISAFTDDVAIVLLPAVLYRSAQLLDMARITRAAHDKGILIGWDLAHSIGSVPHDFKAIDPDFAVWCSYKYLNAGPGASAGLFISKKHFNRSAGFNGWFGNKDDSQFLMNHRFEQDTDANGWLLGTHNLFSMAPLSGTLDLFKAAGMPAIREKSLNLTAYLMYLIDERLTDLGYRVGNPREDERRGGHVSLEHDEAYRISLALRDAGVIPDYREPNVIRLAPIALYTSFEEVHQVVDILEGLVREKTYERYSLTRATVL